MALMDDEHELWRASRDYITGEIDIEELKEIEDRFSTTFQDAMLVISKRKLAEGALWRRFNRWIRRILFVALCVLLCGCDMPIQQGWITAKYYDPGYSYYVGGSSSKSCTGSGEYIKCKYTYHSGHFVYIPATYSIDINSCKHNTSNSECKSNTVYVDQHDYDSYSVGSYYGSSS